MHGHIGHKTVVRHAPLDQGRIQPETPFNLYKCVSVLWDPLIGML